MSHSSNGYSSPTNHLNGPFVTLKSVISEYPIKSHVFPCLSLQVCRMQRPWLSMHSPVASLACYACSGSRVQRP